MKIPEVREFNNFKELLNQTVELYGNNPAFKFKRAIVKKGETPEIYTMSYVDYKKEIDYVGAYLCNLGIKNENVALIAKDRYEWMVTYYAVTTANRVIVPLDKALPENEIFSLAQRSEAGIFIFEKEYLNTVKSIIAKKLAPQIEYYICLDEIDEEGIISYKEILSEGKKIIDSGDTTYYDVEVDSEKMTIMLFTSGTTSASKAVMLNQRNICSNMKSILQIIAFNDKDGLLALLPFHHTFQSTINHIVTYIGGYIAFCDGLKYIQQNLIEYKPSVLVTVPLIMETLYKRIMKTVDKEGKTKLVNTMVKVTNLVGKNNLKLKKKIFKDIHNALGGELRLIVSGAAKMEDDLAKNLKGLGFNVHQGYGLTETSPVLAVEGDKIKKVGSVGRPIPDVEIMINDKNELGIGEIYAKGPNIMLGYYKNDEATQESFDGEWYKTGDLGYIDRDGYLFITGRKKNVIVQKNGKNIYPEELEVHIGHIPGVKESIVYGKPTADNDLDIACKIVYDKEAFNEILGYDAPEEDIKAEIKKYIAKINNDMPTYKHIRDIIVTQEELIKTTTAKVKRHEEIAKILSETK